MRHLFKFTVHPGSEPLVRKHAGKLPEALEGFGTVHAFFRGSALFLYADGDGDPFDALAQDANAKKLLDALEQGSSYSADDPHARALSYRTGSPEDGARDRAGPRTGAPEVRS